MTNSRAVRIEGLSEFQNEMRLLQRQAPDQVAEVDFEIATIVAREAQRRAPHGKHEGGGLVVPIMASIHAIKRPGDAQVLVGGRATPHGPVTEFGGRIPRRGHKGSRRSVARLRAIAHGAVTHVRKQAYLYPAITAKGDAIRAKYEAMLDRWIGRLSG